MNFYKPRGIFFFTPLYTLEYKELLVKLLGASRPRKKVVLQISRASYCVFVDSEIRVSTAQPGKVARVGGDVMVMVQPFSGVAVVPR